VVGAGEPRFVEELLRRFPHLSQYIAADYMMTMLQDEPESELFAGLGGDQPALSRRALEYIVLGPDRMPAVPDGTVAAAVVMSAYQELAGVFGDFLDNSQWCPTRLSYIFELDRMLDDAGLEAFSLSGAVMGSSSDLPFRLPRTDEYMIGAIAHAKLLGMHDALRPAADRISDPQARAAIEQFDSWLVHCHKASTDLVLTCTG
jgi:hypothetical protein